jgi:hypothetical protein
MRWISLLVVCPLLGSGFGRGSAPLPPTIATDHFDNSRQSWNPQEYVLTPANVASNFAKLGTYTVDGMVYAQPLFIPAIVTSGVQHDLLIVATENNTVYAFDANSLSSTPVWERAIGGATTTDCLDLYGNGTQVGIMSTPVADVANNHLFVTVATSTPAWVLYQLNLATGAVISSVTISGSVSGTGSGSSGGTLAFNPGQHDQRVGLTLANGNVYIGFGGYCDSSPWHGWVFAYDASTLSQVALYATTPNGDGGGIWNSAGGFAVDPSGNLYTYTGNGDWDGTANFGNSAIKLSSTLSLVDWFTPTNWSTLSSDDLDVSSGRAMLIDQGGYLIGSGKDSRMLVINPANMGHLQSGGVGPLQIFTFGQSRLYGGAWFNGTAYFQNWVQSSGDSNGPIYSFAWQGTEFNTSGVVTMDTYGFPGAQYTASSNGTANGILWATTAPTGEARPSSPPSGTLRAFDPVTLNEIYDSDENAGDTLGLLSKMSPPTVANGKVFVATQSSQIAIYGLK